MKVPRRSVIMIKPARQRITGQNHGTSHISAGAAVKKHSKARAVPVCYIVLPLIKKQGQIRIKLFLQNMICP